MLRFKHVHGTVVDSMLCPRRPYVTAQSFMMHKDVYIIRMYAQCLDAHKGMHACEFK